MEEIKIEREALQNSVRSQLPPDYTDDIEAHFDSMPDNYFRASKVPDIVKHLKVVRSFVENATADGDRGLIPAIDWEAFPDQGHSIMSIGTWDREPFLAKIAASFSVVTLNILSADVFTYRGDNTVLDLFSESCRHQRARGHRSTRNECG